MLMRRYFCFALLCLLLGLFMSTPTRAQLCNGSLGDPVVFIDFGKGTPAPLAAGVTTYTYQSYQQASCPNDGLYTITSSLMNCFGTTWHNLAEDHTPGDVNGNMMVVNASVTPDDFFVYPVSGLCGGTTYEFSAWVATLLLATSCGGNGTDPNITFRIETNTGQVLGTYSTGSIPETPVVQWKQYGFFFTTPAGVTDLVVRMTNNAPGGCGNDVALDDISFRPCGPRISTSVTGAASSAIDLCAEATRPLELNGNSGGFTDPVWQWQESTDSGKTWTDIAGQQNVTTTVQPTLPGLYLYRISASERPNAGLSKCRVASTPITVHIHPTPIPSIQVSTPLCNGKPWQLLASGGRTWEWTGPGGFSSSDQNPLFAGAFSQSGTYTLKAISDKGCEASTSTTIQVRPGPEPFAGNDQTICAGSSVTLTGTGTGTFVWTSSSGDQLPSSPVFSVSPRDSTQYYLTVTNSFGCMDSDTVAVHVNQPPTADAGPDLTILEGDTARIRASVLGSGVAVRWLPATFIVDDAQVEAQVFPPQNTTYRLEAISVSGCGASSDEVFIRVLKKPIVPNSFSPNGDGVNDRWVIEQLQNYTGANIEVFNRYGQKVFSSRQYSTPWDGRMNGSPLPAGTYYYVITLRPGLPVLSGWLLLVR